MSGERLDGGDMIQKSVPLTEIGEHVETIREFMTEVEEPSDFVADALRRIEAEEARLLEENRKQAEQIKALGEALWSARQFGDDTKEASWCDPNYATCGGAYAQCSRCHAMAAALRLSGRLP